MFGSYIYFRIFVMHGRACRGAGNPVENVAGTAVLLEEAKQKNQSRPDGANSPGSQSERQDEICPDK